PQSRSRLHRLDTSNEDCPKDRERFRSVEESYDDSFSHSYRNGNRSRHMKRRRDNESLLSSVSKSNSSDGRYRRSRSKRHKSTDEDDLTKPWMCEEEDPFTPRIHNFETFLAYFMQQKKYVKDPVEIHNIKQKDGETIEDFMERFKVETGRMKGAPECKLSHLIKEIKHGRDQSKTGKKETPAKDKPTAIYMIQSWQRTTRQKVTQSFERVKEITFPPLPASSGTEGPLIIEAEMGEHMIHHMYVDSGSSMEILYEDCFNQLWPEIKSQMVPATRLLTSFIGKTIWPMGQLRLLVIIGDANHSTRAWMNLMIVKSLSPYNGIIGRPGIREIQAVPSTTHGMLKFPVEGGNVKICSTILIPTECTSEVAIGGTLSDKGRTKLCSILKKNFDIFAWQPSDMTGVPRSVAEHRLNIREGYSPVRQKKRGQAPERAKAIQAEVQKLVEAGIMREVYYHDWLSNPIMVKKHDGSWRMCVAFIDLNKACPQDCYPLPEIDWEVESLCEAEMLRDIEETFRTLRKINMKLNPKKCAFRLAEGVFFGYVVTPDGIKPCPDKTTAVLQLPSPRTIKEVKSLNGKLASLNRFLSKSAEKSLPLFKTLKKCIKKSDFHWTAEAEQAFKQLKQHLSELPILVAPKQKDELIIYLPRTSVKGQILADFLIEMPDKNLQAAPVAETQQESWTLFTDGSSCVDGFGAGLIRTNPEGIEFTYALRFQFAASNNEAEYEALIASLRISAQMGVKNVHVSVDSKLVANQVLGTYVAKEDNMVKYLDKVKCLVKGFTNFLISQVLVEVLKDKSIKEKEEGGKKAPHQSPTVRVDGGNSLQAVVPYAVVKMCKVKFLIVAMDYFTKWIEAKAVATITGGQVKKFVWDNIVCRFGIPGEIVSDNDKQFSDNPFKDWCDKLNITQRFASVKHPQSNRLVERANRKIGMPTYRNAAVDVVSNDEELRLNLDLLEERRERASIYEAKAKSKMTKYYNARVRGVTFRPGDFVYHSNDASHAVAGGKLGPKWEGPYEVTEALGD
nr:reverse transcriptase domain-containing protein [Tanacetum cinerariifolium]